MVKKNFELSLDIFRILKFLLVSIGVFGGVYFLSEEFLEYNDNIFEFLPNLLIFVIMGIIGYLGLTYVIDSGTRKLFNAIIGEVKK